MNQYKWDYITPEVFFSQIEDLAPFSDWEIDRISAALTKPEYIGSDEQEITVYEGEFDDSDLKSLYSFLTKALENKGSPVWFKDGGWNDEYECNTFIFCQGRDPMKISKVKGESFRRDILRWREEAVENAKKQEAKNKKKAEIDRLTARLQNKEISTEEYLKQIKTFQKD